MKNRTFSILTDETLVLQYQQTKCSQSFGELYNRYYERVYSYTVSMIKNRDVGFDLTQDVFIKAADSLSKLRDVVTFRAWLFRIAHNACIDYGRNQSKLKMTSAEERFDLADQPADIDALMAKDRMIEQMHDLIESLDEADRTLLQLKYMDRASIKELQQKMGLSASAVKMRLLRVRNKVITKFEERAEVALAS